MQEITADVIQDLMQEIALVIQKIAKNKKGITLVILFLFLLLLEDDFHNHFRVFYFLNANIFL